MSGSFCNIFVVLVSEKMNARFIFVIEDYGKLKLWKLAKNAEKLANETRFTLVETKNTLQNGTIAELDDERILFLVNRRCHQSAGPFFETTRRIFVSMCRSIIYSVNSVRVFLIGSIWTCIV